MGSPGKLPEHDRSGRAESSASVLRSICHHDGCLHVQMPRPQPRHKVPSHYTPAGHQTMRPQPWHVPVSRCHMRFWMPMKPENGHLDLCWSCPRKAKCFLDCTCHRAQQKQLQRGLHLSMFISAFQTTHIAFFFWEAS